MKFILGGVACIARGAHLWIKLCSPCYNVSWFCFQDLEKSASILRLKIGRSPPGSVRESSATLSCPSCRSTKNVLLPMTLSASPARKETGWSHGRRRHRSWSYKKSSSVSSNSIQTWSYARCRTSPLPPTPLRKARARLHSAPSKLLPPTLTLPHTHPSPKCRSILGK